MVHITKNVTGVYVFEDGDCIDREQFPDDPDMLADRLDETHPLEEQYPDAERVVLPVEEIAEHADMAVEDVYELQHAVARRMTEQGLREAGDRDQLLVQAVRALGDIDEINNEMSERLRPWYGVHFPEMEERIGDNERLAELVAQHADRADLDGYEELAEESTGIPIDETDAKILQLFATQLDNAYEMREKLESYVDTLARELAPNLATLLGGVLAARTIALAGSLEELAKMPASTIQVLGAEKAMFRHMRGEGEAPKHGVLFMHPFVQKVSNDDRGEMARVLANKAAIAARLDRYGGEFKGESLRAEVEERFDELDR